MSNLLLAKNFTATGAITQRRLVKLGANDGEVQQAAAAADFVIGVSGELPAAIGERCDVSQIGIEWVEAGAAITRGALLMSDANGRAITAAAGAGANVRTAGIAQESATALGDLIRVLIIPGSFQG